MGFAHAELGPRPETVISPGVKRGDSEAPRPTHSNPTVPSAAALALAVHTPAADRDADAGSAVGAPDAGAGPAQTAAPKKTVDVYPVLLPGATRDSGADVARANTIWAQCSLRVNLSGGQSWATDVLDRLAPAGVLNEKPSPSSPTTEETEMLAHRPGGASAIHAYFVPSMSDGSRGEAFRPSMPPSVAAVVISNGAAADSLAHELGHVVLDDSGHHSDPDNLMASGNIRNVGVDKLDAAQCAKV